MKTILFAAWNGAVDSRTLDSFIIDETPEFELIIFDYTGTAASQPPAWPGTLLSVKTHGKGQIFTEAYRYLKANNIDYDYIGLMDDDILIKTSDINYMLKIAKLQDIDCFAPGLTEDSYYSHPHTLKKANHLLHWVPWVEVMMPFYKKALFEACKEYYPYSISGWGIDFYAMPVTQKTLGMERIAVIDAATMTHYRPINSGSWVFTGNITPHQEITAMRHLCMRYVIDNYPEWVEMDWFNATFNYFSSEE
jgi:hypothetical protein